MDFNEFCLKIDKLEIANKPIKNIIQINNIADADTIISKIDIQKCYSKQNELVIHNKYEEALEIIKSRYKDFTFKDIKSQAEYITWLEYVFRFKDYLNYLCEEYKSSLITKN